eukprot:RCo027939
MGCCCLPRRRQGAFRPIPGIIGGGLLSRWLEHAKARAAVAVSFDRGLLPLDQSVADMRSCWKRWRAGLANASSSEVFSAAVYLMGSSPRPVVGRCYYVSLTGHRWAVEGEFPASATLNDALEFKDPASSGATPMWCASRKVLFLENWNPPSEEWQVLDYPLWKLEQWLQSKAEAGEGSDGREFP